ncbi:hypothetical protein COOONC_01515 [Cooperia oncophora]
MYICGKRSQVAVEKFYEKQKDLVEAWKEDEKHLHNASSIDQVAAAESEQRTKRSQVAVEKFYEKQKDLVEAWKEDEKHLHNASSIDQVAAAESEQRTKVWDSRLTIITIILNVMLIGAKTTAAVLSDSLAIVASVVDSAMDITSGLVLWYTCRLIERSNKHHYPVGLNR